MKESPLFASRFPQVSLLLFAISIFCLTSFRAPIEADDSESIDRHLSQLVQEQAEAWNDGDIRSFMKAYWQSPNMTFSSGGTTERGWQPTLDRYLKRYPNREAMGQLTFRNLETTQLSSDAALMLGEWHLDKEEPAEGNFSLVWKRFDEGWKIVHDHTSLLTPATTNRIEEDNEDPSLQIDAPNLESADEMTFRELNGLKSPTDVDVLSNDPVFQELRRVFLSDAAKAREAASVDPSQISDLVWHSVEQLLASARKLESEERRLKGEGNPQKSFAMRNAINAIRKQVTDLLLSPQER